MRMPSSNPLSKSSLKNAKSNKAPCKNCSPAKSACRGYTSKPGYNQTNVGVIPEDWGVKPLGSFCEIVAGRDLVKEEFSPTGDDMYRFPIYSNALTDGGLYGYSRTYQYEPNKITVTARGDIGHAAYRSAKFCAIGRLLVLSSKQPCDLRFVTEFINNFVDFALESTGVPQLTAPQISKYNVALPATKAEQTAIATTLSDMDSEIAALEEKPTKARQIKQGMMQELLTGRIRLI
jgi:type I restriction enzyme, S subunit